MTTDQHPNDFGFGEEAEMLRDTVRKYLDDKLPVHELRELVAMDHEAVYTRGEPTAWDPEMWREMADLGWTGLAVPEASGGAGFKLAGIAGVVEQVGAHALPSPLVATFNATHVLAHSEGPGAHALLEKVAAGAAATLAVTDGAGTREDVSPAVAATVDGSELVLDGTASWVQDAHKADWLVLRARHDGSDILCAVATDTPGVRLERNHIHDLTRDQATVHCDGVRVSAAELVSDDARSALVAAWPAVLVTVGADLTGCAEWQLQTTVEYAKNRVQFDRPIGFFQAVKHPLVNGMLEIDRARSLVYHAACCVDEGDPEAMQAARMAKSAASDAGAFISDRSVQLHGGIGFTWECDVHLFFKRSMHNQVLYGDGAYHRAKLADQLIGPVTP